MKNYKRNFAVLGVAAAMAAASVASAVPTLRITDGVTTVTVEDNVGADSVPLAGFVQYSSAPGTFAGWSVIVSGGATKPLVGSSTKPQLDLNFQVVRTGGAGAGTLTICFSENGFNLASATPMQTGSGVTLGTTAANTAKVETFYAANNTVLNTGAGTVKLASQNYAGPGASSQNTVANAAADPSIAFTIKLDLNIAQGEVASGDLHLFALGVPEGGSMVTFLGTALLALGAFAARRKA